MGVNVLGTRLLNTILEGAQRTWLRPGVTHIRRRQLPYWQECGWHRAGDTYTGTYQTAYGSFLGRIEDRGYDQLRFYIEAYLAFQMGYYTLAAQAVEGEAEALRKRATWYANLWPGPLAAVKISKPARP